MTMHFWVLNPERPSAVVHITRAAVHPWISEPNYTYSSALANLVDVEAML